MLNELCQLANSLEKAGITPKEWHPQLKLLPKTNSKKPCYQIWIAPDSTIASIDEMNPGMAAILRKWEPSNGNSFPAFNIPALYRISNEQLKAKIIGWKSGKSQIVFDDLRSMCIQETNNWDRKTQNKLIKCLNETPLGLNKLISTKDQHASSSIQALIQRVLQYTSSDTAVLGNIGSKSFRQVLEEFIWESLSHDEKVKILLPVLIYEGDDSKKPDEDRGELLSVFLDICDWQSYVYPVAHEKSLDWLNDRLLSTTQIRSSVTLIDAFGLPCSVEEEKLPSVKLPIIADVKLRSMFSAHYCQYRYGTIEAGSFPVGKESRTRAKGALEWLGDPSREGQTWGRADEKELLFAYPSVLPKTTIFMAAFLGTHDAKAQAEARFADAAIDVIAALQRLSTDLRSLELRVFSLKKMDKARTKVAFYRNYTAQRLVDAAKDWQVGCTNLPEFRLKAWKEQKGEWEMVEPKIPYPLQIASCLNHVWKLDGSSECETKATIPSQGIELFLDEHADRFAPHLLTILLQNSKGLLLSLGNAQHMGTPTSFKGKNSQILFMPAILGLLLYKLGIYKENYMANTPFLVGRILKLSDELHALYCQEVRNNSLPPQLVGNALMVAALDSPVQALAQLSQRLNPYLAWAKQFRTKNADNSWKAGWLLKLFEETTSTIADSNLPSRCSDAEKAQLFIGYLSSLPRKQDTSPSTIASDSN